jgi:hypothetical protein
MGRGRGQGPRPLQEEETGSYDSCVKQQPRPASATIVGLADGPNTKGNVREQIEAQFSDGAREPTDPLTEGRLPRSYREHTRDYFNRLREGQ